MVALQFFYEYILTTILEIEAVLAFGAIEDTGTNPIIVALTCTRISPNPTRNSCSQEKQIIKYR